MIYEKLMTVKHIGSLDLNGQIATFFGRAYILKYKPTYTVRTMSFIISEIYKFLIKST